MKEPRRLLSFDQYAPNGKLTRSIGYNPDGSINYDYTPPADPNEKSGTIMCSHCDMEPIEFKTKPEYNDKGQVIKESDYTTAGELISWRQYKYDGNGNRIEEYDYRYGQFSGKLAHTYDEGANKVSTCSYDSNGKLEGRREYKYDAKRNLIEEISYDPDGTVSMKTRYDYDTAGNVKEYASHYANGSLSSKEVYHYKYDAIGNWIERNTYTTSMLRPKEFGQPEIPSKDITEILYRTITYY